MSRNPKKLGLTLDRYFALSWWLLVALSIFLSYTSTLARPFLAGACFFFAALSLTMGADRSRKRDYVFILMAFGVWVLAFFRFQLNGEPVKLIGECLLGLVPLLLIGRFTVFGYWVSLLNLSLVALASVIFEGEVQQYALYLIYLFLVVFNINAANLLFLSASQLAGRERLPSGYFKQFIFSLGIGGLVGVLIFVLFPRTYHWTNPLGLRTRGGAQTGYKGSVNLESSTHIDESAKVVMRVQSQDNGWLSKVGPSLYFRGNTVDEFDGKSWKQTVKTYRPYKHSVDLRVSTSHYPQSKTLSLYREPHTNRAIFYPGLLSSLSHPPKLLGRVKYDPNGSLIRGHEDLIRYAYQVSVTLPKLPSQIQSLSFRKIEKQARKQKPGRALASSLSYPDAFLSIPTEVRRADFFNKWVAEVGIDPDQMSLRQSFDILNKHFRDNFTASLIHDYKDKAPLEAFLTTDRQGHCEYFATATALYYRFHGIPSRVVLGYRGGTFNQFSNTLEVRESHAHAWVELFFPRFGWLRLDPTPFIPTVTSTGWWETAKLYSNAISFWFNQYVVDYNNQTQRQLWRALRDFSHKGRKGAWKVPSGWTKVILIGGCLLIGLGLFRWSRRRDPNRHNKFPRYYREFTRVLEQQGYRKEPSESFSQFHARVQSNSISKELLTLVNTALEQDLYAPNPTDSEASERLRREIRQTKKGV